MIRALSSILAAATIALAPAPALAAEPCETEEPAAAERDPDERDTDRQGWMVPDFAKLQTGGYVGLIGIGVGYAVLDDILNLSALYGFTPAAVAGVNVHAIGATLSVRPFDINIRGRLRHIPLYIGGGLLFGLGDNYFLTTPDEYNDRWYYVPTAVHWLLHVGTEVDVLPAPGGVFERHGLLVELVTLDTFLLSLIESQNEVELDDVLSLALGYRAAW